METDIRAQPGARLCRIARNDQECGSLAASALDLLFGAGAPVDLRGGIARLVTLIGHPDRQSAKQNDGKAHGDANADKRALVAAFRCFEIWFRCRQNRPHNYE